MFGRYGWLYVLSSRSRGISARAGVKAKNDAAQARADAKERIGFITPHSAGAEGAFLSWSTVLSCDFNLFMEGYDYWIIMAKERRGAQLPPRAAPKRRREWRIRGTREGGAPRNLALLLLLEWLD